MFFLCFAVLKIKILRMETKKKIISYVKKKKKRQLTKWVKSGQKRNQTVCVLLLSCCFFNRPLSSPRSWEVRPWGGLQDVGPGPEQD